VNVERRFLTSSMSTDGRNEPALQRRRSAPYENVSTGFKSKRRRPNRGVHADSKGWPVALGTTFGAGAGGSRGGWQRHPLIWRALATPSDEAGPSEHACPSQH
jgi:hypothetical protein